MRALSDEELVRIWDRGRGRAAWYRALLPLAEALDAPLSELADWPLGRRDGWLLALRAWTLGPVLEATARCPGPGCGIAVEVPLAIADLLAAWPPDDGDDVAPRVEVEADGWRLALRPPTSRDIAACAEGDRGAVSLLRRCVLDVRCIDPGDGEDDGPPASAWVEAEAALARADPLADVEIALTCPGCGATWADPLNVAEYVWSEFGSAARAALLDVHALASVYGWTEREILRLDRARRGLYRELIGLGAWRP